jgi:hypothetical protein
MAWGEIALGCAYHDSWLQSSPRALFEEFTELHPIVRRYKMYFVTTYPVKCLAPPLYRPASPIGLLTALHFPFLTPPRRIRPNRGGLEGSGNRGHTIRALMKTQAGLS